MPRDLVFLSLSQLTQTSSFQPSIQAFSQSTGWPEYLIRAALGFDLYVAPWLLCTSSCLQDYNLGRINTDEFCTAIRRRLQSNMRNEDILKCWNAMCTLSQPAQQECNRLATFLDNNPLVDLVLVTETNPTHFEHICDQSGVFSTHRDRFHFAHSYEKNTRNKETMAQNALEQLSQKEASQPIGSLTSLHRDIPVARLLPDNRDISRNTLATGPTTSIVDALDRHFAPPHQLDITSTQNYAVVSIGSQ